MVPPKFYFAPDPDEMARVRGAPPSPRAAPHRPRRCPPRFTCILPCVRHACAQKFHKFTGKQPKVPKHERKLQAIERKKARLDPEQQLTPLEQQQRLHEAQLAEHEEKQVSNSVEPQRVGGVR